MAAASRDEEIFDYVFYTRERPGEAVTLTLMRSGGARRVQVIIGDKT